MSIMQVPGRSSTLVPAVGVAGDGLFSCDLRVLCAGIGRRVGELIAAGR